MTREQIALVRAEPVTARLRMAMRLAGRTVQQVAQDSGMSEHALFRIVSGTQVPKYLQAIAIGQALGVSAAVLFGGPDPVATYPREWRVFAARHDMPVDRMVEDFVEQGIATAEAYECGYAPQPIRRGAEDDGIVVMRNSTLRRLLGVVDAPPVDRTAVALEEARVLRERGHSWADVAADTGLSVQRLVAHFSRAQDALEASA